MSNNNSNSTDLLKNIDDYGIISLMYHRFEENKYPSTNIKIKDFKKQIEIIQNENIRFSKQFSPWALKMEKHDKMCRCSLVDGGESGAGR